MAYAAWSVVAGEQPTAAKWNILGTNDASFNDGSGLAFTTNNVVPANALSTSAITLGYAPITANFSTSSTTAVQVTGLTLTVTVPAGSRKIKITAHAEAHYTTLTSVGADLSIWDGTPGSGTKLATASGFTGGGSGATPSICIAVATPSAGSKTYNVGLNTRNAANAATLNGSATSPAILLVEVI